MSVDVRNLCHNILQIVPKQKVLNMVEKMYKEEILSDRKVVLECVMYILNSSQQLDYHTSFCKAGIIQDLVWEKLNTGHWKEVCKGWRTVYALVAIFRILNVSECLIDMIEKTAKKTNPTEELPFVEKSNHDNQNKRKIDDHSVQENISNLNEKIRISLSPVLEDLVKMADMGLLLGAPVLQNTLENIAQQITEHLSLDYKEDTSIKHQRIDAQDFTIQDVEVNLPVSCKQLSQILRVDQPSLEDFIINYKSLEEPVILTGCMEDWPAMSEPRKWKRSHLVKVAGPRTVPVEIGRNYTSDQWTQKLMTVKDFAKQFLKENPEEIGYLAQHQLLDQVPSLAQDIIIPDFCYTGDEDDVDMNVWIGPKGTVSPLHTDPKHNVLCQVSGSKYIVLYPAKYSDYLYPHPTPLLFNTSRIDLQVVDTGEYPEFMKAEGFHMILKPGEMLYIPPGVWHFVKSLEISFSVSFWWK